MMRRTWFPPVRLVTFPRLAARLTVIVSFAVLLCDPSPGLAVPFPGLGTAQSFAVLGNSTVTNTGSTTINGDLGLYDGPSVTGFAIPPANTVEEGPGSTGLVDGPGLVSGTIYISHDVAEQAQIDALAAYNFLAAQVPTEDLTGETLGDGVTGTVSALTPGIYSFDTTVKLDGELTLNFGATPDALFVFLIGTALTTESASVVNVLDGDTNSGVYWLLGTTGGPGTGSAILGTSTVFAGNILALDDITLTTTAKILCGRAIALNGAVSMDTNTISNDCTVEDDSDRTDFASIGFSGVGGDSASPAPVPEPSTLLLLGSALAGLAGVALKRHPK